MNIQVIPRQLDWSSGLASNCELFISILDHDPNNLNLMHQASTYVQHHYDSMSQDEFMYYFSVLRTCLNDVKVNPSLASDSNGLRCLEKADQILACLLMSPSVSFPLVKATIVGLRAQVSAAKRVNTNSPFRTIV